MSDTTKLLLPLIEASQAQKHVTHNESLLTLDVVVQLGVLDRDLTAPPAGPADGDTYVVAPPATDAWAGNEGNIASWQDGVWQFRVPRTGWIAWIADEAQLCAFDGAAWVSVGQGLATTDVTVFVAPDSGSAEAGDVIADIQAAIDSLERYRFGSGARGLVKLRDGIFPISVPLRVTHPQADRIELQAQNAPSTLAKSDFNGTLNDDETALRSRYPCVIECQDCSGVEQPAAGIGLTVRDLAFIRTSGSSTQSGYLCYGRGAFSRCAFFGFTYGIQARDMGQIAGVDGVVVLHSSNTAVYAIGDANINVDDGGGEPFLLGYSGNYHAWANEKSSITLTGGGSSHAWNTGSYGFNAQDRSNLKVRDFVVDAIGSRAFYGLYGSYVYAEDITLNGHVNYAGQFRYGTVAYVRNITIDAALGATEKTIFADYNSHITEQGTNLNATFNPSVGTSGNKSSSVV
ncbi:MAG: DUF2793 domain-containing protein [Pseudomonadota bacterium]